MNELTISYKQFGAVGDGVTDDFAAICKAHKEANRTGAKVLGEAGATYLIRHAEAPAIIRTDVDWCGAKFIVDNRHILPDSKDRSVWIFELAHDRAPESISVPEGMTLTAGQSRIDLSLGRPCLLKIQDQGERIYSRWGENANGGVPRQEMILVDKDGNVDPTTPIQYDYKAVTDITAYSSDDTPITVENASFVTLVCDPREVDPAYTNHYCYHNRGIHIMRSNALISHVNSDKQGEHETVGVPYNAFYRFDKCYNVELRDSEICGQRAYSFMDVNKHTGAQTRNEMGSYSINMNDCIDVRFINLTQVEDGRTGEDVITNRKRYHGVMGSNFCRDLYMEGCYLDRFDSHQGAYNATVRNSTIGFSILIIGGGTLLVENCKFLRGYGGDGAMVHLRGDYNSIFDGDVIVRGCVGSPAIKTLVEGRWHSFYGGLPNYMIRTLTVDDIEVHADEFVLLRYNSLTNEAPTDEVNPAYLPTKVTVRGMNVKPTLFLAGQEKAFADTEFIVEA